MQFERKNLFISNLRWLIIDETDTLFETGKLDKVFEELISRSNNMSEGPKIILSGTTCPPSLKALLKK